MGLTVAQRGNIRTSMALRAIHTINAESRWRVDPSQAAALRVSRVNRAAHSFHSHNVSAMKTPVPTTAPVFLC